MAAVGRDPALPASSGLPWENGGVPLTAIPARSSRDLLLILATHPLGEADRIIVGLTAHHGMLRAVAKGVRRASSKMGARLEPFMVADVSFVSGRSLATITQAVTVKAYSAPLVADWDAYVAASAICEVADRIGQGEQDTAAALFPLTAGALSALARHLHDPRDVLDSYLLRALAAAGWSVSTNRCVRCGGEADLLGWSVRDGGAVGSGCLEPGDRPLRAGDLDRLDALARGDWAALDSADDDASRRRTGRLVRASVQWHLDQAFRSFDLLEERPR